MPMDTSDLTLPTLPFKTVCKDRWFYDRFEYCMAFDLDEINSLRVLNHKEIDRTIHRRCQWREMAEQRWAQHGSTPSMHRFWRPITDKTIQDLHALADVLLNTDHDFKLVVGLHQGHIYSNDPALLQQLDGMPELANKTYSRAQIDRPKNTVRLQRSKYSLRSYFRYAKLTDEQKQRLTEFLNNQLDHVRLAPSLKSWICDAQFKSSQDYFFVDYNNSSWITMLNLVHPGLIRKTMPIVVTTK